MPLYDVMCNQCGAEQEVFRSLSQYEAGDWPKCCGHSMGVKIAAPRVMEDLKPYRSMVDGSIISGRAAHRAHLRQHGMIEVGNEQIKPEPRNERKEREDRKRDIANVLNNS
jgi:hypothetical protein